MRGNVRWGVFVHDPDGDMGDGLIVGPFKTAEIADKKAASIRREAAKMPPVERGGYEVHDLAEPIVVPVWPGGWSVREVIERVMRRGAWAR